MFWAAFLAPKPPIEVGAWRGTGTQAFVPLTACVQLVSIHWPGGIALGNSWRDLYYHIFLRLLLLCDCVIMIVTVRDGVGIGLLKL